MTSITINLKDEEVVYLIELVFGMALSEIKIRKQLQAEIENLKTTHIESVKSVADAKQVLLDEGYIFYKRPEFRKGKKLKHGEKK